jgi:hypothetical protein
MMILPLLGTSELALAVGVVVAIERAVATRTSSRTIALKRETFPRRFLINRPLMVLRIDTCKYIVAELIRTNKPGRPCGCDYVLCQPEKQHGTTHIWRLTHIFRRSGERSRDELCLER